LVFDKAEVVSSKAFVTDAKQIYKLAQTSTVVACGSVSKTLCILKTI